MSFHAEGFRLACLFGKVNAISDFLGLLDRTDSSVEVKDEQSTQR